MLFNFFIPLLTSSSEISEGTYRFVFKDVKNFSLLPDLVNKEINIEGKNINIVSTEKDLINKKYKVVIKIQKSISSEAKINSNVIAIGLITIFGVGMLFMSFDKVEKLMDSPTIQLGMLAVFGFVLVKLMKTFKR